MIGRLVHHAEVLTLSGDSYRTRTRRELLGKNPSVEFVAPRGEDGRWMISTGGEGWTFPAVPARSHRRRPSRLELGATTTRANKIGARPA